MLGMVMVQKEVNKKLPIYDLAGKRATWLVWLFWRNMTDETAMIAPNVMAMVAFLLFQAIWLMGFSLL
jgi:hypothetical protein